MQKYSKIVHSRRCVTNVLCKWYITVKIGDKNIEILPNRKGLFTVRESGSESEIDQRTSEKDQSINGKHQRNFSLSHLLSSRCEHSLNVLQMMQVSLYWIKCTYIRSHGRYDRWRHKSRYCAKRVRDSLYNTSIPEKKKKRTKLLTFTLDRDRDRHRYR